MMFLNVIFFFLFFLTLLDVVNYVSVSWLYNVIANNTFGKSSDIFFRFFDPFALFFFNFNYMYITLFVILPQKLTCFFSFIFLSFHCFVLCFTLYCGSFLCCVCRLIVYYTGDISSLFSSPVLGYSWLWSPVLASWILLWSLILPPAFGVKIPYTCDRWGYLGRISFKFSSFSFTDCKIPWVCPL